MLKGTFMQKEYIMITCVYGVFQLTHLTIWHPT